MISVSTDLLFADLAGNLFAQFKKDHFFEVDSLAREESGISLEEHDWEMKSGNGKVYSQTILNRQVEELVKLGHSAFPVAFEYLDHPYSHIRYIAAESLERISGAKATWYPFGNPQEEWDGSKTWADEARTKWIEWYFLNSRELA